jgi:hypothetical protein
VYGTHGKRLVGGGGLSEEVKILTEIANWDNNGDVTWRADSPLHHISSASIIKISLAKKGQSQEKKS